MKPREFSCLYDPETKELTYGHRHGCTDGYEYITVREVIPINWERVWEQFKLQGIRFEHKNFLQTLIEKQLKGEE